MLEVEIGDNRLHVDEETAETLKDHQMAKQYLHLIKQQLSSVDTDNTEAKTAKTVSKDRECILWKTKKSTQLDHEATLAFLALRKQFDGEFSDKKSAKNSIWSKIVERMNDMFFFVGDGVEGREKLRQKFANMTATYLKTIQKRSRTGEGKISYPLYFEEMDNILGDKHKVTPQLVIDSATEQRTPSTTSVKNIHPESILRADNLGSSPCSSKTASQINCFESIKSLVRLQKQSVLATLEKIHQENLEHRKNEFKVITETLRQQNQQRHEQIMALITSMNNKPKNKKRRRESDSE